MTLLESAVAIPPAVRALAGRDHAGPRGRGGKADRTLGTDAWPVASPPRAASSGCVGLYLAVDGHVSVATYYVLREFAA